mmetsp:Transcript_20026/g.50674  ORF Transcript_20026/g.50674 Transcript_20026/m.50674 type:complete len:248 (+) Transcript_20026:752-1495(+)
MLTPLSRPRDPGGARLCCCLVPLVHDEMACDTTSSLSSTSLDTALPSASPLWGALSCLRSASAAPISLSLLSPPPFLLLAGALTGSSTPARFPAIRGGARSPPLRTRTALATAPETGRLDVSAGPCADLRSIEAESEKAGLTRPATPPASPSSSTPPSTRPRAARPRRDPEGPAPEWCPITRVGRTAGPLFAPASHSPADPAAAAASGHLWAAPACLSLVVCAPILGNPGPVRCVGFVLLPPHLLPC